MSKDLLVGLSIDVEVGGNNSASIRGDYGAENNMLWFYTNVSFGSSSC